jgi:hypothetical protein
MNRPDQLRSHMARARNNGVREDELIETITHLAFYAGWPSAVTATGVAREVFKRRRASRPVGFASERWGEMRTREGTKENLHGANL